MTAHENLHLAGAGSQGLGWLSRAYLARATLPAPATRPHTAHTAHSCLQALSEPARVRHELGVAVRSLEQLEEYAGLSGASSDLVVSLRGSCD